MKLLKGPFTWAKKIGKRLRKNLRVKGTSSHFTQIQFRTRIFVCFSTRILAFFSVFISWYWCLRKVANATDELNPATSRAWFDYICDAGYNRATYKRSWTCSPGSIVHRVFFFCIVPVSLGSMHSTCTWTSSGTSVCFNQSCFVSFVV